MTRRFLVVGLAALFASAANVAEALCSGAAECREETSDLLARLDDGARVRGALDLLADLDHALNVTCHGGDADACRLRIQLHAARRSQDSARIWNRTARQYVAVDDPTFAPERSHLAMRESYGQLVALEFVRAQQSDSVAGYEAFVSEFGDSAFAPQFRRRIAELGLVDVVAASRRGGELESLFAFRLRVDQDDLVEPTLFGEVLERGTANDVDRYLRELGSASSTPSEHVAQMQARLRTLTYDAAFAASGSGDLAPILRAIGQYPDAPEVVRAFELVASHVDAASPSETYDAIARAYPNLAIASRPRAIDVLTTLLERMNASERSTRCIGLFRAASAQARARIATVVAADARTRGGISPLFELLAAAPSDASAQAALADALVTRGPLEDLERFLALGTLDQHPAEQVESVRTRLRGARFEDAIAQSEVGGIEPLLRALIDDPRHAAVPDAATRIVAMLPTLAPTAAFDTLAPNLSDVPAHVREPLADAAVELLVRMGTRDRLQRFAEASAHASLRQRQRLAEILRAELPVAEGVAGVGLLRRFALSFPGTAAAREANRDADAREATERTRRTRESLQQRANRFRR